MTINRFPVEVAERLKWYVYRLIDPRNGETFYVGKGQGDRIFQHVKGALAVGNGEDAATGGAACLWANLPYRPS